MYHFVLSCFREVFNITEDNIMELGVTVLIPRFDLNTTKRLINETIPVLQNEKALERIDSEVIVVGDIHGNFFDLIRILIKNKLPPESHYIFLGDYVDRGRMSLDVITLLFAMKCAYPECIKLIRGNHEFRLVNAQYGFLQQLRDIFGNPCGKELWEMFNTAFDYLPLACVVKDSVFCVHGGISEGLNDLSDIENIQLPVSESNALIYGLTWSDPSEKIFHFASNPRGRGSLFGRVAVQKFLDRTCLKMIIRSHQSEDGFKAMFDNKICTVFSASNYSGFNNSSGFMIVTDKTHASYQRLKPFPNIHYDDLVYNDIITPCESQSIPSRRSSQILITKKIPLSLSSSSLKQRRFSHIISSSLLKKPEVSSPLIVQ